MLGPPAERSPCGDWGVVPAQAVGTETPQFWGFSLSGPRGWRMRGAGAGGTQWAMSNPCLGFACAFGRCKWGARRECVPGDTNAALSSRSVRCHQAASQAKSCHRVVTSPDEPAVDECSCYSGEGGGIPRTARPVGNIDGGPGTTQ